MKLRVCTKSLNILFLEEKLYSPTLTCQPGSLYLPNRFYTMGWNHKELPKTDAKEDW